MKLSENIQLLRLNLKKYQEALDDMQAWAKEMVTHHDEVGEEHKRAYWKAQDEYRKARANMNQYGKIIRKQMIQTEKDMYPEYAGIPFLEEVYE